MSVKTTDLKDKVGQTALPMNGQSQPQQQVALSPEKMILDKLQSKGFLAHLTSTLPKGTISPEKMTALAFGEVRKNQKLAQCSVPSLLGAVMKAAQMGLEIGALGDAYLVPYKDEATLIVGYQGLINLMYRSPLVKTVSAKVVYSNDAFEYVEGSSPMLIHTPACGANGIPLSTNEGGRGAPVAFYAIVRLTNGDFIAEFMSYDDAIAYGKEYGGDAWKKAPIAMGLKTVVRKLAKFAPKAVNLDVIANEAPVTYNEDTGDVQYHDFELVD